MTFGGNSPIFPAKDLIITFQWQKHPKKLFCILQKTTRLGKIVLPAFKTILGVKIQTACTHMCITLGGCILLWGSIPATCKAQNTRTTAHTSHVIATIAALPEVKRMEKHLQPEEYLSILVRDTPTTAKRYYWVQAGISNPARYTPVYNFAVYPPGMSIGYINTLADTIEPLKVWRERKDNCSNHQ